MKHEFQKAPVTFILIALSSLIYLAMLVLYGSSADTGLAGISFGGMYGVLVKYDPSQLWRLVTPIFVHFGFEHVFLNMLTVYFLGQMAEQIWGSGRFLALYVLSGIMGNAVTLLFTPNVVAAGASTSIFGLFAAVIVLGYFGRNPYLQQLGRSYQALLVINLLFNLFTPGVSLAGHLGGLLGGALCAIFLPAILEKSLFSPAKRALALLAYLVLLFAMVTLALWF